MAKKSYYFSHDCNARADPKVKDMMCDYKAAGYGVFWAIVEVMSEQDGYRLPCTKQSYRSIAMDVLWDSDGVTKFVQDCIHDYGLFCTDGDYFWSESLLRRMGQRDALMERRAEAGKAGAKARYEKQDNSIAIANAQQTHSTAIAKNSKVKESKVKESKVNEIKVNQGNDANASTRAQDNERFSTFWACYPKKVARRDAERAWAKLKVNEELYGEIIHGLSRAKLSEGWTKEDGKYIPNPATFLNGARWADEYKSGGGKPSGRAANGRPIDSETADNGELF